MIKGMGPIYAKKLARAFSEAVFDVIEQKLERLPEVEGIGPKRAKSIVGAWADQKAIEIFLHSYGATNFISPVAPATAASFVDRSSRCRLLIPLPSPHLVESQAMLSPESPASRR